MRVPIGAGNEIVEFEVADKNLVLVRAAPQAAPMGDVPAAVHAALDQPHEFPPLRQALTPDDHIAIVVDEALPRVASLLTPMLEQIASARIAPELITLLFRPGQTDQSWVDDIPDAFQDVHLEVHDPHDRNKLSYLATTKRGRRVYLNRTLVDADQVIVLGSVRYDPLVGYTGTETAIFPALSDQATRVDVSDRVTMQPPGGTWLIQQEAVEVCWLLGNPFFVQVIEGSGDSVCHVVAGAGESGKLGRRLLDERWRVEIAAPADIVIAGISAGAPHPYPPRERGGRGEGHDFDDLARAFASASRVVRPRGRIFLLSAADPPEDDRLRLLKQASEAGEALSFLRKQKLPDMESVFLWANAAQQAALYLLSNMPTATAEELFTTPLDNVAQVQKSLGDARVLFLPDAHKTLAVLKGE